MPSLLTKTTLLLILGGCMQANDPARNAHENVTTGTPHFPRLTSKDLAGNSVVVPEGFPGERSVVLIAFTREQQHDIDSWVTGLHLDDGKLPWLEIPVIDNPGAVGRWFIDSGMRRGIANHETWKHVVTLYTGKAGFKAALGLPNESTVYALVVDRQGKVIASVPGPYTAGGAETIQRSFAQESAIKPGSRL